MEAYQNPINISDTGIIVRNYRQSRITTSLIFLFFNRHEKFIDYAGGYGLFTRMMRDIGLDFYWSDPYTANLLAKKFEIEPNRRYHLATSFESFEHFEDPTEGLGKILEIADNIILSTELLPSPTPNISDWWYYGPEHGQHISIYTQESFKKLAHKFQLHYYNLDNFHLLTKKKITIFGRLLFQFKYAKHILYILSFFIVWIIKSKTLEDMTVSKSSLQQS
ncbi:MAG: class I SAM-dependent methyltransferase [Cyclobacteriaceae bacterium]|nr:class I SAM-dependent methyltransferase [Cyclobacteriaceae bacterium]